MAIHPKWYWKSDIQGLVRQQPKVKGKIPLSHHKMFRKQVMYLA